MLGIGRAPAIAADHEFVTGFNGAYYEFGSLCYLAECAAI
jgi:hypothetical protein